MKTNLFIWKQSCHRTLERTFRSLVLGWPSSDAAGSDIIKHIASGSKVSLSENLTNARCGKALKTGQSVLLHNVQPFSHVVCFGLDDGKNADEAEFNSTKCLRSQISYAARTLTEAGVTEIEFDPCNDPQAVAEGAALGLFKFDDLKTLDVEQRGKSPALKLFADHLSNDRAEQMRQLFAKGLLMAEAQNLSRRWQELPANHLTPSRFGELCAEQVRGVDNIKLFVRSADWIREQKMSALLSVARGSVEAPVFVELHYTGAADAQQAPLCLVGKGVTFDSGGISIKPSQGMESMRADMGGAACVVATVLACARLRLAVNVSALVPLCENMPSGSATRPGDVVTSRSGLTIQVDNTDAEGRLLLADALSYAADLKPAAVVDVATLTGAMRVALGGAATGLFTNSDRLWRLMHHAGSLTKDFVWRMPLWQFYASQMKKSHLADLNNIGSAKGAGGSCTAAGFLWQFAPKDVDYAHLDIAGVMEHQKDVGFLVPGMTGRPVRTLIKFVELWSEEAGKKN